MAKMIEGDLRKVGPSRYPWADWMNGSSWEVSEGVDFSIPMLNFRAMLHGQATRTGKRCVTRAVNRTTLRFQFVEKV